MGEPTNPLVTRARLDIRDDVIHYRLYQQDGSMQAMRCADTQSNRLFVSWVQAFDRMGARAPLSPTGGENG